MRNQWVELPWSADRAAQQFDEDTACAGLHTIEEIHFCNLNFIVRFTFHSSLVFDPLKSEIIVQLGLCAPHQTTVYHLLFEQRPFLTCAVGMRLYATLRFKIWL